MGIARRRCKKCNVTSDDFRLGRSECRQCEKKYTAQYRKRYPNKVRAAYQRWRKENIAFDRERKKEFHRQHPEYIRNYSRYKRQTDLNYRIASNLRCRLYSAIRGNYKQGSAIRDLGCSIDEFKQYIAALFQNNMSWDNYGQWHLDHIQPLSAFDLTDKDQVKQAVHYTNLQPLWAIDNQRKGGVHGNC